MSQAARVVRQSQEHHFQTSELLPSCYHDSPVRHFIPEQLGVVTSRRICGGLGASAGTSAFAGAAIAASSDDDTLLAMLDEIVRLRDEAGYIDATRVKRTNPNIKISCTRWAETPPGPLRRHPARRRAFGAHAAHAGPDASRARRDSKALLYHCMPDVGSHPIRRGPPEDLDFEIQMARSLLGQFAGMTEEELVNV
jgi:hypothetical protein